MAKTTTCAFCGKEVTTGIFGGDAMTLTVDFHDAICCQDCYEQYRKDVNRIKKRLKVKLENYVIATGNRKLDSKFVADVILRYLAEEKEQIARCGTISNATDMGYYVVDREKGYFAMREFERGSDITTGQTVRNMKRAEDVGEVWFSKEDVTRMEYTTTLAGDILNLFSTAYTFEIRFNDEKNITYKPCITRLTFVGKGFFPHNQKQNAKDQCAAVLKNLKDIIGADVPVVYVKHL